MLIKMPLDIFPTYTNINGKSKYMNGLVSNLLSFPLFHPTEGN